MNIPELKAKFPMPWNYVVMGGNIRVLDAVGKELPMFVMLDFMCEITRHIEVKPAGSQPQPG